MKIILIDLPKFLERILSNTVFKIFNKLICLHYMRFCKEKSGWKNILILEISFLWAEIGILFLYAQIAKIIEKLAEYVSLLELTVMSTWIIRIN